MSLSVIIITKNEATMLPGCLKSVTWADQLIVVDSGSTDKTVIIAKKYGAQIISLSPKTDYSLSRNEGKKAAINDWLLYIDADERLSSRLKKVIKQITKNLPASAVSYRFPRQNIMLGRWLKHGGFWPDYVHRLFYKSSLIKWSGKLHESPIVKGRVETLAIPLSHYTARSINQALNKSKHWSQIEAQLYFKAQAPPVAWWKIIKAFVEKLLRVLVIKFGFLDGTRGFILAYIQAFHEASMLVNLWQLQQKHKSHD